MRLALVVRRPRVIAGKQDKPSETLPRTSLFILSRDPGDSTTKLSLNFSLFPSIRLADSCLVQCPLLFILLYRAGECFYSRSGGRSRWWE